MQGSYVKKMKYNTISVLIPTKDRCLLLRRALSSIETQDLSPDEIIIVNDASSDDTQTFLDQYGENNSVCTIVHMSVNKGVNTARNRGIQLGTTEWVACLDDDDELVPGAIRSIKDTLETIPEHINVVYFNSIIDYGGGESIQGGFRFSEHQEYYDPTYEETMTKFNLKGDCKPVFRKSLFDNPLYRFPETVNGYESYTMNLIARDGKGIRYINKVSTLIHFDNTHSHISITAPRKNPQPLLDLHIKQLDEHRDFYKKYPKRLEEKYLTMVKLAVRAYDIKALLIYGVRFLLSKVRT